MAKIIGVVNTKGGVDKTSVYANLYGILADVEQRLLTREFTRGTVQMLKSLEPQHSIAVPMAKIPALLGIISLQDHTSNAVQFTKAIRKQFYDVSQDKISIFDTWIPYMSNNKKTTAALLPVHRIGTERDGSMPSACEIFLALAHELYSLLPDTLPQWGNAPESLTANPGGD